MVHSLAIKILIEDLFVSKIRVDAAVVRGPIDLGVLLLQDFRDVVDSLSCCYVGEGDSLRLGL